MTNEFPPPAALKPNKLKKWIRTKLLTPYLYKIPANEKTLDIACGWGFSFDINPNFFGLELDDECVQYCQQKGFNVKKGNLLEVFPFEMDLYFCWVLVHERVDKEGRKRVILVYA